MLATYWKYHCHNWNVFYGIYSQRELDIGGKTLQQCACKSNDTNNDDQLS